MNLQSMAEIFSIYCFLYFQALWFFSLSYVVRSTNYHISYKEPLSTSLFSYLLPLLFESMNILLLSLNFKTEWLILIKLFASFGLLIVAFKILVLLMTLKHNHLISIRNILLKSMYIRNRYILHYRLFILHLIRIRSPLLSDMCFRSQNSRISLLCQRIARLGFLAL